MTRGRAIAAVVGLLVALLALGGATYWGWTWWKATRNARVDIVSHPAEGTPAPAPTGAPNVVVVIGCTVRRDQTTVYRPELDTTPYLASLGERGAVFEDVITAAPWTRPASVALLTGRHAISVGMVEPGQGANRRALQDQVVTAAEHFRAFGWSTVGATANPNLSKTWNLHQGFDRYIQPQGIWSEGVQGKMPAARLTRTLLAEVAERDPNKPIYVQAMFIEAHAPWRPLDVVPADATVPETVHQYRAALGDFDRAVEGLHDGLRDLGLTEDNTIFVVVNDHGEGLSWPPHHGAAHGRYLAPSAVGGVWVMAGPGVQPRRIWGLASQVDVFPTVADLAGVPIRGVDGQSLRPALKSGKTERLSAFTDTWFGKVDRAAIYTPIEACQQSFSHAESDPKFRPGCFDRVTDPTHSRPHPDPNLMAELEIWREEREIEQRLFGATDADPDADTVEQLRALGYVD